MTGADGRERRGKGRGKSEEKGEVARARKWRDSRARQNVENK